MSCRRNSSADQAGTSLRHLIAAPARIGAPWLLRLHANDRHHAQILVIEDVAVIDEAAHNGAAEVHAHGDARKGAADAIPVVNRKSIVELSLLLRHRNP